MVRGLLTDINFAHASFTAASLKGCDLFPFLWDAIERLTRLNLHVHLVTSDGASCMFSMHRKKNEFVNKTINVFSKEEQYITSVILST